jgi:ribosomal protein S18 acetylase RimI-like enzyme
MGTASVDVYVEAFVARCHAARRSGMSMIAEPGICGLLPRRGDGYARLLVTDDRARDRVVTLVGDTRAGMITVCAAAAQSASLLQNDPAWHAGTATAMICRDLRTVTAPQLPPQLTLRPVRRLARDDAGGVPLTQAVAAACRADPERTDPRALAAHLRSLPRQYALWVAVDHDGVARGTVGSAAFGTAASVIFVNTDPAWRRRGVARTMTAIALEAAEQSGARRAGLDASDASKELYQSLGFQVATPITRFRPVA